MSNDIYNQLPDTSRSTIETQCLETTSNVFIKLIITREDSGLTPLRVELDSDEIQSGMTCEELKQRISLQSGGNADIDSFGLMYKNQILHNKQTLRELRLDNEDTLKLFNESEAEITVTSDHRAAQVKNEGIRLMQ